MKQKNLLIYSALLTTVLFWGLSFVWSKEALKGLSVYSLIFLRFTAASLLLGLAVVIKKGKIKLFPKQQIWIFLTALFEPFLYFIFETNSLTVLDASVVAVLAATIPLFVTVMSGFLGREKLTTLTWICAFMSLGGICLLVGITPFSHTTPDRLFGAFMMGGAVISAVAYILLVHKIGKSVDTLTLTFYQMTYGALFLLPLFIIFYRPGSFSTVQISTFLNLGALVLLSTFAAFLCYNYALSSLSPSESALYLNAIPVVTMIASFFIIREIMSPLQFAGAALVLISLYLVQFKRPVEYEIFPVE